MARIPGSPWQGLPPKQLASHPDAPSRVLLGLCKRYPHEVLDNASLPLIGLADPAMWTSIVFRSRAAIAKDKINGYSMRYDPSQAAGFLIYCAQRVLPLLEADNPTDTQPRRLLEAATSWARGELDASALSAVWAGASSARWPRPPLGQARWVFDRLAFAPGGNFFETAMHTAEALALAAGPGDSAAFDRAYGEELERQVNELERLSSTVRRPHGDG